jgi:hypothetical protein
VATPRHSSAARRVVRSKDGQTGRQVADRIAFKSLQGAHREAFNRVLREVVAEKPHIRTQVVIRAFVASLRAELEWYEGRSAGYLAQR